MGGETQDWRKHPDYAIGYHEALDGIGRPGEGNAPYMAGWEAGEDARRTFASAGFVSNGRGSFSLTLAATPSPGSANDGG